MQHIELPAPLGHWPTIGGADDEAESTTGGDETPGDELDEEDTEDELELDETSDDEVGGGEDDEAEEVETPSVVKPTGADLLALLAEDPDAQTLMANALTEMQSAKERDAQTEAERAAFNKLVETEDYAGIGKTIIEQQRRDAARSAVTDEVLKEQFTPIYQDLLSQPEIKTLTAEEKLALAPKNFNSDAAYVKRLAEVVTEKRMEAKVEERANARAKELIEAARNGDVAAKAKVRSIAGGPPPSTSGSTADFMKMRSGDILSQAFSAMLGGGETQED